MRSRTLIVTAVALVCVALPASAAAKIPVSFKRIAGYKSG